MDREDIKREGFEKVVDDIRNTPTKQENSVDYPECRGMTFVEFWNWLPNKLILYDYEEELLDVLDKKKIFVD